MCEFLSFGITKSKKIVSGKSLLSVFYTPALRPLWLRAGVLI